MATSHPPKPDNCLLAGWNLAEPNFLPTRHIFPWRKSKTPLAGIEALGALPRLRTSASLPEIDLSRSCLVLVSEPKRSLSRSANGESAMRRGWYWHEVCDVRWLVGGLGVATMV